MGEYLDESLGYSQFWVEGGEVFTPITHDAYSRASIESLLRDMRRLVSAEYRARTRRPKEGVSEFRDLRDTMERALRAYGLIVGAHIPDYRHGDSRWHAFNTSSTFDRDAELLCKFLEHNAETVLEKHRAHARETWAGMWDDAAMRAGAEVQT